MLNLQNGKWRPRCKGERGPSLPSAEVHPCGCSHDSNTLPYWEYHDMDLHCSVTYRDTLGTCSTAVAPPPPRRSKMQQNWKNGMTVLGIYDVSATPEMQKAKVNEQVKTFSLLPRWICVCLRETQQWPRISHPFLLRVCSWTLLSSVSSH